MRLIDAEALLNAISEYPYGIRGMIETEIAIQKTVDAVPVRHGKWIYGESDSGYDGYYCSHCMGHVRWYGKVGGQSIDFISDYHYCPNCGADMIGDNHV